MLSKAFARALAASMPRERIATDARSLRRNSGDYHWFSNVLEQKLEGYGAEAVVWPENMLELAAALAAAHEHAVPVTLRGGGTGNYGQCVPLEGGLVVNFTAMNKVIEFGPGSVRVEPGITFAKLEQAAFATDQELRIFPSTYRTGTVGGFLAGGSGGVGSIEFGTLADDNVASIAVCSLNESPEPVRVEGPRLGHFVHAYGTTGVITEVTLPLVPRRRWEQAIVSFDSFWACHAFCLDLLADDGIAKRSVTGLDPSVVAHFRRANAGFRPGRAAAGLIYAEADQAKVRRLIERHHGELDATLSGAAKTQLFEFSWNHSTLWAKKEDRQLTYMQAGLAPEQSEAQMRGVREAYGDAFSIHAEYVRWGGQPLVVMLPIFRYESVLQLQDMISLFESLGIVVANPHTYLLEEGSHVADLEGLLDAKREHDPRGLLNPGKLASVPGGAGRSVFRETATMALGKTNRR